MRPLRQGLAIPACRFGWSHRRLIGKAGSIRELRIPPTSLRFGVKDQRISQALSGTKLHIPYRDLAAKTSLY